jgi:hypothetical protein
MSNTHELFFNTDALHYVTSPLARSSRTTAITAAGERSIMIDAAIMPIENWHPLA